MSRTIERAWVPCKSYWYRMALLKGIAGSEGGPPPIDVTGRFFEYYWMGGMGWDQCWRELVLLSLIPTDTMTIRGGLRRDAV